MFRLKLVFATGPEFFIIPYTHLFNYNSRLTIGKLDLHSLKTGLVCEFLSKTYTHGKNINIFFSENIIIVNLTKGYVLSLANITFLNIIIRGKQNYEAEENTLNTLIDFFTRQCQQMKNRN